MAIDINDLPAWAQKQVREKQAAYKGQAPAPAPKPNKYHAQKDERAGITFDSKKEAARYDELMVMLRAGEIRKLKLQPEFTLQEAYTTPEGERIQAIRYRADFSYERQTEPDTYGYPHWILTVEDAKGLETDVFQLKCKLFRERMGFDITVV